MEPPNKCDPDTIRMLEQPDQDPTCRTFIIKNEDHTIGNMLQFVISRYSEVEFCACTITHPLEEQLMVRIQTKPGVDAKQILVRGLVDIEAVFTGVKQKFADARHEYEREEKNRIDVDT